MATLSTASMTKILASYDPAPAPLLLNQLSTYLDLLLKWNARTNLSSIRDPEEIIARHFGESLFAARHLPPGLNVLDLGSGAGFPGLPIALANPNLRMTLSESQNKKAAFLREVVRELGVEVEVWADRVENLPPTRLFDIVTMRAVDNPRLALTLAEQRLNPGGSIVHLKSALSAAPGGRVIPIPGSDESIIHITT